MDLDTLAPGRIYLTTLDGEPCPVRLVESWPPSPWQPHGALYVELLDRSDRRIIPVTAVDGPCGQLHGCYDRDGQCWHCRRNTLVDPHQAGCPHQGLDDPAGTVVAPADPDDACDGRAVDGDDIDPHCTTWEVAVELRGTGNIVARAGAALATLRRHGFDVAPTALIWTQPAGRRTQQYVGRADIYLD